MTARELYQAGKLDEAVGAECRLRNYPEDVKRRTFLFELLCFAGNFDRAEKQLDILSREPRSDDRGDAVSRGVARGAYRREMFEKKDYPTTGSDAGAAR